MNLLKHSAYILAVAVLMALSGQTALYIPGIEIPITWQSLFAILLPLVLPRFDGVLGILLFLLAGAFGAPVFANGSGGLDIFQSASAGYLIGFLIIGIIAATSRPYLTRNHPLRPMILFFGLHLFLGLFGMAWAAFMLSKPVGIGTHILPFLPGIIIKAFMGWGVYIVIRITLSDWRNQKM